MKKILIFLVLMIAIAVPVFSTNAVYFDSATRLLKAGGFTGLNETNTVTISYWIKKNATTDDVGFGIQYGLGQNFDNHIPAWNIFTYNLYSYNGSDYNSVETNNPYTSADGWMNVLMSCDFGTCQLYINDVDDTFQTGSMVSGQMYLGGDWNMNGDDSGNTKGEFCIAEFWFSNQTFDLSFESNRRKFITSDLKIADLGTNGELPTGNSPNVYFNGDSSNFFTNKGTGGDAVVDTGTLLDCDSNPPESVPVTTSITTTIFPTGLGVYDVLSESGSGLGVFLDAIRQPLGTFIFYIAIVGGLVAIVVGIAFLINKGLGKV